MTSHVTAEQSANSLPLSWQRLLALSGVAFAILFLVGWFASGGDAPDYGASDQAWTNWADDNQWKSRIGAFAMLLAGFVFLHFVATIRTALGDAETRAGGSPQLARVAFAGAITGMAGMVMAIVIISSATTEGADTNPIVTRAIASSSAGPFLLSAMGFAAFLMAGGLVTIRTGVFTRWTGIVALIGAASFLVAFAAVLSGLGEDSLFGFGFFPGVLALVIWSIAASIASYRAVGISTA
jgi:succinate dehydrogenase/fumarate reductase cytochrome b subunit